MIKSATLYANGIARACDLWAGVHYREVNIVSFEAVPALALMLATGLFILSGLVELITFFVDAIRANHAGGREVMTMITLTFSLVVAGVAVSGGL